MPPTPVSINQLSMAGRRASAEQSLLNARFIHAELIARRAAMLQQFQEMPEELANAAGVQELAKKYHERLGSYLRTPYLRTAEDEQAFASVMQSALPEQLGETRKAFGVSLAALAAAHEGQRVPREQQAVIDRHIDRIFLSRVGIHSSLSTTSPRASRWTVSWGSFRRSAARQSYARPPPPRSPPSAASDLRGAADRGARW